MPDLQQTIALLTSDHRLYAAPIETQPYRVLDAGCGTGIWGIEYGATRHLGIQEIMLTSPSRRAPGSAGNRAMFSDGLLGRIGEQS